MAHQKDHYTIGTLKNGRIYATLTGRLLTPLVFNDIADIFVFIFIMQIFFNVWFVDPAFSRLLLGLLGDGRRKVARPKWLTPCNPLSHLLLAPAVLEEGITLRLLDVAQDTNKMLESIRAYLREQGAVSLNPGRLS